MGQTIIATRASKPFSVTAAALMVAAVALMVILRIAVLDSDAYSHLSWSSALLTDEGFYIHNARNVVLFGGARTDEFNNMLIMPVLHYVQLAVFRLAGAGAVQARSISIAAALLELGILYFALRRCMGQRIAAFGLLFLGLGHAGLLYSRMALMDTPAALGLVSVFALWVSGASLATLNPVRSKALFAAAGVVIAATYATRGLSAWFIPVPFAVLLYQARIIPRERDVWLPAAAWMGSGLVAGLAAYAGVWYMPHRAEISAMTAYYVRHQMLPPNIVALKGNITHALFGDYRGLAPYLFRHSPVEFTLSVAVLGASAIRRRSAASAGASTISSAAADDPENPVSGMAGRFLIGWLAMGWLTYSIISYAPDRYYVMFYPAMAALSAVGLCSVGRVWEILRATWTGCAIAGLLAFHAAEALTHHENDVILGIAVVVAVVVMSPPMVKCSERFIRAIVLNPAVLMAVWVTVNGCWMADWMAHLTYARRDADRWLASSLPANSILIGDVAPGLCLDNRFEAISVIPGLCNARYPLQKYAGRPRYIVILDERFLERYWRANYPEQVAPARRVRLFPSIVKFPVGIYRVDDAPAATGEPATPKSLKPSLVPTTA